MTARKLRWRKDGERNIPIKEAIWQYILDHSHIGINYYGTRIKIKDKESFMKSLQARINGKYRYSEEDLALTHPSNRDEK